MLKWLNKDLADVGKVGITFGAMDLLHGGHIAMLAEAKRKCDYLVVGLQNDPSEGRSFKNAPVQTLFERQLQLSAVRYVDDIIVYNKEEEINDILLTLPIKVRIIGEDYLHQDFTGKELCEKLGIEILYNSRSHSFSTSELRKRVHSRDKEEIDLRNKENAEYMNELTKNSE